MQVYSSENDSDRNSWFWRHHRQKIPTKRYTGITGLTDNFFTFSWADCAYRLGLLCPLSPKVFSTFDRQRFLLSWGLASWIYLKKSWVRGSLVWVTWRRHRCVIWVWSKVFSWGQQGWQIWLADSIIRHKILFIQWGHRHEKPSSYCTWSNRHCQFRPIYYSQNWFKKYSRNRIIIFGGWQPDKI